METKGVGLVPGPLGLAVVGGRLDSNGVLRLSDQGRRGLQGGTVVNDNECPLHSERVFVVLLKI